MEYEAGSRIPILEGRSEGPTGPSGKAQTLVQGGGGALMFGGHATSEIMPYIISEVPSALVMPTPCGSGPAQNRHAPSPWPWMLQSFASPLAVSIDPAESMIAP
jgi:hypothetical protein